MNNPLLKVPLLIMLFIVYFSKMGMDLVLEADEAKAIETGMILSIMDMKKKWFFHRSIFTEIKEFATIV